MAILRHVVAGITISITLAATVACGSAGTTADDVVSIQPATAAAEPSARPSPDADTPELTTRHRMMVIEDGDRPPELCVGGVAQSLPPLCGGVILVGWDWGEFAGEYEQRGRMAWGDVERGPVRWGEFVVAGEYSRDDNTLTVTSAEIADPGDTPDTTEPEPPTCDDPAAPTARELAIQEEIVTEYDGALIFWSGSDGCGTLEVGVAYDDGSIQVDFDKMYGDGTVAVISALALRE